MAERGAFFEGGREPFPGGKKVPFPPQTPPILPKTAHMLFCPTGQSLPTGRTAPEKKQGEMPQGTTILSVKPRPGKYPPKGEAGGRIPAPASTKKESVVHPAWPPGNACSAFLFPQAKKGKPSASAYGPVTSGHARQCHTIKKRLPLQAASDERFFWGAPLFAASSDRRRLQGRARCDEGSCGHRQQSKGFPPPTVIFPRYRRFPARGCCKLRSWPSVPACA